MMSMSRLYLLLLVLPAAIPLMDPGPKNLSRAAPAPSHKPAGCTNTIGMKFVYVPPGKFFMGAPTAEQDEAIAESYKVSGDGEAGLLEQMTRHHRAEGPVREVEITKGYYLGVYEVTQAEYKQVVGNNPSLFSPEKVKRLDGAIVPVLKELLKGQDTTRYPVDSVSYADALDFCKRLSDRPGEKKAGRVYRLPTEAEWEYACRAGTRTAFSFGKSLSSTQANFCGKYPFGGGKEGSDLEKPCVVGSYKPNAWGLHDMHGNASEWCSDWYDPSYHSNSPKRDPEGKPVEGYGRVFRGGNRLHIGGDCRSATRQEDSEPRIWLGFRVVLVR